MSSVSETTTPGYPALLAAIRRELQQGLRAIERQKILTYWAVGRKIHAYFERQDLPRGGIGRFYQQLSADLLINERTLQQCEQFYRFFPGLTRKQLTDGLSWSHYRYLLSVPDRSQRRAWIRRIREEGWTTNDLRFALARESATVSLNASSPAGGALATPRRGRLYTYRLVRAEPGAGIAQPWLVDCGFANRFEVPSDTRLQNKWLYTSQKSQDGGYLLRQSSDAKVDDLYTFAARLKRVVDGDTLLVLVDQGFGIWTEQRLRLKGIDAPELKTLAGRRVKAWLADRLTGLPFLIVKTYRADKYDRYLADVFLPQSLSATDREAVAASGTYLNQELLARGWADPYP